MMDKDKPNYYAIIPAEVRYSKDLTLREKMLYGEITALTNKKGYCYATNRYFAELYDITKETVSRSISNLKKYGFIKVKQIKKNNQFIERRVYIKKSIPIEKNLKTPIDKNLKQNNTSINNTRLNNTAYASIKYIKETWNKSDSTGNIKKITDERKQNISDLWENDILVYESEWKALIENIKNSNYLQSKNWFNFDWVIESESNAIKVLEGKYTEKHNDNNNGSRWRSDAY